METFFTLATTTSARSTVPTLGVHNTKKVATETVFTRVLNRNALSLNLVSLKAKLAITITLWHDEKTWQQNNKIGELTKGNVSLISFEDETLEEGEMMLRH
jgi:hypothetical protein